MATVTIITKDLGKCPGTIGWLNSQEITCKFGSTTCGWRAAFLTIAGETCTVLVDGQETDGIDWFESDGINNTLVRSMYDGYTGNDFRFRWTDAAFAALTEFVEGPLKEQFEEWLSEGESSLDWQIIPAAE